MHPRRKVFQVVFTVAILLCLFLVSNEQASAQTCIVQPGLIGWWPGDGNANDLVGGNHGSLSGGVTFTTGRAGQTFAFDGDGFVQAPTIGFPTGNGDRTMELWAWVDSYVAIEAIFAAYGNFGAHGQSYVLGLEDGKPFFSQWGDAVFGPTLQTGQWYHIAVTNRGSAVTLYLNGVSVASKQFSIDTPSDSQFRIGKIDDIRRLHGLVDVVGIFNRALSAEEIETLYLARNAGHCLGPILRSATVDESGAARLEWSPMPDPDTAGYKVHYDIDSGIPYAQVVDVGLVTSTVLSGLDPVVYYLAVSAYDSGNTEPPTSNELTLDLTPPTVQFRQTDFSIGEISGTAPITLSLNKAYYRPVTVTLTTTDGTATSAADYIGGGSVSFAPGQVSQTHTIQILPDALDELDETIHLALQNPVNAGLGTPNNAVLTIVDDDGPEITLTGSDYQAREGDGVVVLTATLSVVSPQTVTVAYATADVTALAGDDYTAVGSTLAFAPGELVKTISVPVFDDETLLEESEILTLALTLPNRATLGTPNSATITIEENDINAPPISVAAPDDPAQPVVVHAPTPAGEVQITLEGVQTGGAITVEVTVTPRDQPPGNFILLGVNYQVSAPDVSYSQATLSFPYRAADIAAAGIPEESLRLLHWENGEWKDVTMDLGTAENMITGVVDSFSPFVLGVQTMETCAISLNNGASYVGQLNVQVFALTPSASEMRVSNDGGFTGAPWQSYRSALDWTLADPGSRIVTLLVYARLRDGGDNLLCGGASLTDDIIYDPLPPTILSATVETAAVFALSEQGQPSVNLRLTAEDQQGGSGLAAMQISADPNFIAARWQPYSPTSQLAAQHPGVVYVRVRDGAGNISSATSVALVFGSQTYLPRLDR